MHIVLAVQLTHESAKADQDGVDNAFVNRSDLDAEKREALVDAPARSSMSRERRSRASTMTLSNDPSRA
jgi:hypothetical protein